MIEETPTPTPAAPPPPPRPETESPPHLPDGQTGDPVPPPVKGDGSNG